MDDDPNFPNFIPEAAVDDPILRARVLVNTVNEQIHRTRKVPVVTDADKADAMDVFTGQAALPEMPTPGMLAQLGLYLAEFDRQVVIDAAKIRNYVTNRLLLLSTSPSEKTQLNALKLLGQINDVALFTERKDITVHNVDDNLIATLKDKIKRLQSVPADQVVDVVDTRWVTPSVNNTNNTNPSP